MLTCLKSVGLVWILLLGLAWVSALLDLVTVRARIRSVIVSS